MADFGRLAARFVNIERVVDIDVLDIYHDHDHLASVEEQADHMVRLPELYPFEMD